MSVDSLRDELRLIAEGAEWHARNYVLDVEPDRETLADAIADMMAVYCQTGSILTADWYSSRDRESKFFARPAMVVPPERATDTAAWVFKKSDSVGQVERRMGAAAYSMVYDAARDTVTTNAAAEGVAYVRVEERDACDDCKRRATRTPRERTSPSDDVTWERHQRCEFLFEPVRKGVWTPPEYVREWPMLADAVSAH